MRHQSILSAATVAALGLLAPAVYAHGGNPNLVHACVNNSTQVSRIVSPNASCPSNQTAKHWAIQGPKGNTGAQGPAGPQGSQGIPGEPGLDGLVALIAADGQVAFSNKEIHVAFVQQPTFPAFYYCLYDLGISPKGGQVTPFQAVSSTTLMPGPIAYLDAWTKETCEATVFFETAQGHAFNLLLY